ncbi:hypothetical protein SLEP1_g19898 [Rubroshorea leprosula]|uniref:Uncharacterized protein n=1 Tax=Rubroshorea leprosula TaxID=152421 RepID=A0AAV5J9X5_9ROSI|nr:hypothetical protein SLEP1_g19898 [Rubroshorea leprosula]
MGWQLLFQMASILTGEDLISSWNFFRRRPPFGGEHDELELLKVAILRVHLSRESQDQMTWQHNHSGYSARAAYFFMDSSTPCLDSDACN